MSCGPVRERLSAFLDGELGAAERRSLTVHLAACADCATVWRGLQEACGLLAELPRLVPDASIADSVAHRLDVESRGPGLALIFRSPWRARPMILPALAPAAVVFAALLSAAMLFDRGPSPIFQRAASGGAWDRRTAPSGTEGNPLFPSAEISAPRVTARGPMPIPSAGAAVEGERSVFLETVVARDGRVAAVFVLDGDAERGRWLAEALRQERFEPALRRGRPVAVSVYRLFSQMEVRAAASRDGA